ncbi:MAG: hypothetical protein HY910_17860 [Desulfarculus sp.]|nr:hypothetical protein [Desulfarculus sp.]
MDERTFKPIVKELLKNLGLMVIDIPPRQEVPTPDFEAIGDNDSYTIELKIKGDDPELIAQERKILLKGGIVSKSIPVGPRNTLGSIIRSGVQQMLEHDPVGNSFRVIWLHSAGQDSYLHFERFRSTLFGSETLFSLHASNIITCYYFHESAFYSWRDYLDGAILTYSNNCQLCINSLSPRVDDFRKSKLVVGMAGGLCDPQQLAEDDDDVMIADCDLTRKDSDQILSYLCAKYGFQHLQPIPMQQHTGKILVQSDRDK